MRKHIITAALVCFCLATHLGAQALLEDFATIRKNLSGDDLFNVYDGGTATLSGGMWAVTSWPTRGFDWQFFPIPYTGAQGFAQGWLKSGSKDPNYNRMRFKMRCNGNVTTSVPAANTDLGTYVKPTTDTCTSCQGQHYYHSFSPNVYKDRWLLFIMNRHPQHRVGDSGGVDPGDDPEWVRPTYGGPVHYLDGLTRFYFEIYGSGIAGTTCSFDDITMDRVDGEPDAYVASISVTHSGSAYELVWATPKNQTINYEIRYSTSSMKSAGFASGTSGGTVTNSGSDYPMAMWKSPNMGEPASGMYFAIRPSGQTAFTEVYLPAMNGTTAPPPASPCDVNSDGAVNVTDINLSRDAAIGKTACNKDLDGNGRCDVVDTQRIVNASLGGACKTGL